MAGTIVNTWGSANSRLYGSLAPNPPLAPYSLQLDAATSTSGTGIPTAGNWLIALSAWRQDAGAAGVIAYPSTVGVTDDVHNFWVPVSVTQPAGGIVRVSAWIAPAARAPGWVFTWPTAYQQAEGFVVWEVTGACPWYSLSVNAQAVTNQGTGVTATFTPPSGVFCAGILSWDLDSAAPTITATGWTAQPVVSCLNGTDTTGDLIMNPYSAVSSGSALTLTAASGATADYSVLLVSVHGLADQIAFPYSLQVENWPALVTEMACGQVLNSNFTFSSGVSPWTGSNSATLSASALYGGPPGTLPASAPGSMVITPDGVHANPGAQSEQAPGIVPGLPYTVTAWVTVPAGWSGGAQVKLNFSTSGLSFISAATGSVVSLTAGQQTQLTVTGYAPATAARGQVVVQLAGASVPAATTLVYVAYASLAIPGAFGNTAPDQIRWTDLSARTFTESAIQVSRGIQYEQQSLEAGTMELPLDNNDGSFTAGNTQSIYYPYAGQTDVPIRLRAIWPGAVTPYSVLFSGFTDDIKIELDEATLYGYALVTASDVWSRLTAQMVTAAQQEVLADIPAGSGGGFWTCNDAVGATAANNLAPTSVPALVQQLSQYFTSGPNFGFGATNPSSSLVGDPNGSSWFVNSLSGTTTGAAASLLLLPPSPSQLPPLSGGVTVEFWVFFSPKVSSITWQGVVAACVNAAGLVWTLTIGTPGSGTDGFLLFTAYDSLTGASVTTQITNTAQWNTTHMLTISFTATAWTVLLDGGLSLFTGTCNFTSYAGFAFNGLCLPFTNLPFSSTLAGFNGGLHNIALFPLTLPQPRAASHYTVALNAAQGETDVQRIARVAGYGGFTPPMAMLNIQPPVSLSGTYSPGADQDPVTQITDTLGQVVSSYATNVASSTLAAMFVNGPGTLVYRRRLEWYNRAAPAWVLGENAPVELNADPAFTTLASWQAQNGATLTGFTDTSGTLPPPFMHAGVFSGNGVTIRPQLEYVPANSVAVTPGQSYQFATWWYSPQGYSAGITVIIQWVTSGHSVISTSTAGAPLAAAAAAFVTATGTAPATAAFANLFLQVSGTPASSVQFYTGYAGFFISPGEAPYLRDVRLSDDRANMFNTAVLNQAGTSSLTTFSGTSFSFTPTSGVQVTARNTLSAAQRGAVPYTATLYLQNTVQAGSAFIPGEGSVEDFGSWVVNTLGTPVLRGEQAVLTPASTWQDMVTALQAEVGDTVTLNRRPIAAPATSLLGYLSHLSHEINIADQGWTTTFEISPAPAQTVLQCDSAVNGVLDGTSLLGW